jgi:hypothetical protein
VFAALCAAPLCTAFADDDDANVAATCVNRANIRSTKVLDDRNVLFVMRDKSTRNSVLTKHCPGLRPGTAMSFAYADGKLCAGSAFTVMIRSGPSSNPMSYWDPATNKSVVVQGPSFVPGAVCHLGIFTPIAEDEIEDLLALTDQSRRSKRGLRDAIKTEKVELPQESSSSSAPKTE